MCTKSVRLTIDGRAIECAAGSTVLAAAQAADINVPTLCHDARLAPTGACRLCMVEVAGSSKPRPACSTLAEDGMAIQTATPALTNVRTMLLQWLARDYPRRDGGAPANPFERLLAEHGVMTAGDPSPADEIDASNPYIRVDMARCIECYRCVRVCRELQGQDVWHLWDRGSRVTIHPTGWSLGASACVSCGACVDTCPSGALTDSGPSRDVPQVWTRTICSYCGVGCELEYGVSDGRITAARPVREAPVNRGHACVKGRYAFAFVDAPDRVTAPMIRFADTWRRTSWPEAVGHVASALKAIVARHGPDAVGVLASARATNEENYVAQKFARVVIGTNNVDSCARVCHAPSAAALKDAFGARAATNSFDDIEQASTILVCGANPTESHPVVGARIRQAARRGAAKLIVIDPRRIELAAEHGALHLALRPGTNVPLLNAIAQTIVSESLTDQRFLASRVEGQDTYTASLAAWPPERAAGVCGVRAEDIRLAARLYATHKPSMILHGLGVTEHGQGTDGVRALANLALLTGNLGVTGAGVNPLRGQNNVQGAAQMGCDPGALTGGIALESARRSFEALWGCGLPEARGLKLLEMIEAVHAGHLKALIVIGYDILKTNPNTARTRRALESLDLLVVQDMFLTKTASLAHVFLPAASPFEKNGTYMNAERRVQRVRKVIDPRGESKPDADVLCALAAALGHGSSFAFGSAETIWDEVRAVWPATRGMTYARLERGGLQWPCPSDDHPGTAVRYKTSFLTERAPLQALEYRPTTEIADTEYPFLLVTGRTLYQFNAGTMSDRTPNHGLRPEDTLDVSPLDAARLNIADGDPVQVTSRRGHVVLPARIRAELSVGQLFATFHSDAAGVNSLTSDVCDPIGTPEYKVTAVRVQPLAAVSLADRRSRAGV